MVADLFSYLVDVQGFPNGLHETEVGLFSLEVNHNQVLGMVEVVVFQEVIRVVEHFLVVGEVEGEVTGGFVLGYAVVPVFLNTADEGLENLAEIHVRVHSFGDVAVEHRTLVLPE